MSADALTQSQVRDYVQSLGALVPAVTQLDGTATYRLQFSDVAVLLRISGDALARVLLPALAHLATDTLSGTADIVLDVLDGVVTGPIPPPPFSAAGYHRYGQRAAAQTDACALMHAPDVGMLFAYDYTTRHGICWIAEAARLSIYERAAPLQTLLHWALRDFGWQVIHAAAIGAEQGGVLLIGNSGAGKSTTALSCLTAGGLQLLSDDKCLARVEPAPQAFAVFSSGKVKADMLERLPHLHTRIQGWDDNYKAGKGLVFLYPDFAARLVTTFPIRALVLPRVAHRTEAALRPIPASAAFRVFGPSTVIWLPGAEAESYRLTAELTRRLPCYELDLALEPARNAEAIQRLLEQLA